MTDELLFVVLFMFIVINQAIELKPLKNSSYWEVRFICTVLIGFHVKTNYLLNFVHNCFVFVRCFACLHGKTSCADCR